MRFKSTVNFVCPFDRASIKIDNGIWMTNACFSKFFLSRFVRRLLIIEHVRNRSTSKVNYCFWTREVALLFYKQIEINPQNNDLVKSSFFIRLISLGLIWWMNHVLSKHSTIWNCLELELKYFSSKRISSQVQNIFSCIENWFELNGLLKLCDAKAT